MKQVRPNLEESVVKDLSLLAQSSDDWNCLSAITALQALGRGTPNNCDKAKSFTYRGVAYPKLKSGNEAAVTNQGATKAPRKIANEKGTPRGVTRPQTFAYGWPKRCRYSIDTINALTISALM